MAENTDPMEQRLRDHLQRVAEQPPQAGLEQRILAATESSSGRQRVMWSRVALAVAIAAITVMLVIAFSGHESVNNVFSNVSNGLNVN